MLWWTVFSFLNLLLVISKVFLRFFSYIIFFKYGKLTEKFATQSFYQKRLRRKKKQYVTLFCRITTKTVPTLINYKDPGIDPSYLLEIAFSFNILQKINWDVIVNACFSMSSNSYRTNCRTYTIISSRYVFVRMKPRVANRCLVGEAWIY